MGCLVGIYNYTRKNPVDRELLQRMADSMSHRGPDDPGFYLDDANGVGLGFRRLSVIDLSTSGRQPMGNEDGALWLVFNGELYDFQQTRQNLESKGHIFRSRTDTEVLIHQYEEQGVDCLPHLNGMFAFALWDARRHRLMLARDRVGKKPLYYYDDGQRIIFTSELKAILQDGSVPRNLDWEAMGEYFALGYVAAPKSIFAGIRKVPPGHFLILEQGKAEIHNYWDWLAAFREVKRDLSEAEWVEAIWGTLNAAVGDRLISDVPLGAFLSGGVDSSAVVASMAGLSPRPVKTFTLGFIDRVYQESSYARLMADYLGTDHHELIVQPEKVGELLPQLARQYDEPFADPSALPAYYAAKLARDYVTVCLSGEGGNEACAGYDRYYQAIRELWMDRFPHPLRRLLLKPLTSFPVRLPGRRFAQRWLLGQEQRYAFGLRQMPPQRIRRLLTAGAARLIDWEGTALITAALKEAPDLDQISRMQYADARTMLPENILVKVDRASMLNSLEVRCPLLDYRFLELMATVPPRLHLRDGQGKFLFKKALQGLVPQRVLDQPNRDSGIPFQHWFQDDLSAYGREILLDRRTLQREIFSRPGLTALLRQAAGRRPWTHHLWVALVFEMWCREYLDGN